MVFSIATGEQQFRMDGPDDSPMHLPHQLATLLTHSPHGFRPQIRQPSAETLVPLRPFPGGQQWRRWYPLPFRRRGAAEGASCSHRRPPGGDLPPDRLARTSTACFTFHRLIADPSFLRRYRSLHSPLLLGFLNAGPEGFQPAEAPHPNAPAARAIDRAANFFRHPTQGPRRWDPTDICDGRILFEYGHSNEVVGVVFPDLAVCDPLSRRYRLLPPIPDSIVASVHVQERDLMSFQTFLLPSGSEEDEASFRVIGMAHCEKKTVVFVFSSVSGCWSVGASTKWDALSLTRCPLLPKPHYVYGCFYWRVLKRNKLIKLDMSRMEFSTVDLPPDHNKRGIVIVEAGEGRLGMFSLMAYDTSVYYAIRQREDVGANEWQMENVIPLPVNYNFYIDGAPGGYIFLLGIPKARDMVPAAWFSLEINTLKIQRVSGMRRHYCGVKPYFGFPPSMSPRRV